MVVSSLLILDCFCILISSKTDNLSLGPGLGLETFAMVASLRMCMASFSQNLN